MFDVLLVLIPFLWLTSCAPPNAAREQPMSQTFSEDGSGVYKVGGRVVGWGPGAEGVPFAFDPDFPAEFRVGCVNAAKTWNQAIGRDLIVFSDQDARFSDASDGRNVISFGKSARQFSNNHAAETVIHVTQSNPHIIEADIDLDTRHFAFGMGLNPREADVESVCLHELGHALGLTHVANHRSIMNPRMTLGIPQRTLSPVDLEHLAILYPPPRRTEAL